MGTQEDDVGSKTSSYSWSFRVDHCVIPASPSSSQKLENLHALLNMDYIGGKHKCVEWPFFFFFFWFCHSATLNKNSFLSVFIYQCLVDMPLASFMVMRNKETGLLCSKELMLVFIAKTILRSYTCKKPNLTNVIISKCIYRLHLVRWHLHDVSTASLMWCSFTQRQFHPSADLMFSSPSSRTFTAVHRDSAETWLVAKVCFCSSPLEVSHDLGFTINRLHIITYPETNATWAWLPRKNVQVMLGKRWAFQNRLSKNRCSILSVFLQRDVLCVSVTTKIDDQI